MPHSTKRTTLACAFVYCASLGLSPVCGDPRGAACVDPDIAGLTTAGACLLALIELLHVSVLALLQPVPEPSISVAQFSCAILHGVMGHAYCSPQDLLRFHKERSVYSVSPCLDLYQEFAKSGALCLTPRSLLARRCGPSRNGFRQARWTACRGQCWISTNANNGTAFHKVQTVFFSVVSQHCRAATCCDCTLRRTRQVSDHH